MKRMFVGFGLVLATALLSVSPATAGMITYPLNLSTSLGNPVTDILILESDGAQVHASIYPSDLPGSGPSVINHTVPFTPVQTLVIGLTQGTDGMGNDKTQLVMLLDKDFAAANVGIQFSLVFPGAKHSVTIANLQAAVAGDAAQLAWFTDTFFSGPAAGAAFASGGEFSVAEFTDATVIGGNAAFGSWMITDFTATPPMGPNDSKAQIEETAKIDLGPFDVVIQLSEEGDFTVDKTVLNNTGRPWTQFKIELGTGSGAGFVPAIGGLRFLGPISETTGAFPEVDTESNQLVFTGSLPPGGTANFVFRVNAPPGTLLVTLRQSAVASLAAVPAASAEALLALIAVLGGAAAFTLRRRTKAID